VAGSDLVDKRLSHVLNLRPCNLIQSDFFVKRANLGAQDVHIKLTPNGEFEGCESINLWPGGNSHIPESVRRKLAYDDIVVVRPAPVNMKFAYFMEMLNSNVNVSAYLEYTSISAYLPKLLENIDTLGIAEDLVQEHLNVISVTFLFIYLF